ncbi:hypothetical protein [Marinicella gelatinilytica]|uniref:hypothetical protein n=1 Tax=Marinicella gelatinilytica TaxID=2996017 RepID=UPI002260AD6F|nr:hypothetical protein [Marinicella gelatinilytica]MCX7544343.1 hypothetical protein [Marinicella gelatinilytica]
MMKTILFSIGYVLYFMGLGIGSRIAVLKLMKLETNKRRLSSLLAHGLFMGMFIHVLLLNGLQLFGNHNGMALVIVMVLFISCLGLIVHTALVGDGIHKPSEISRQQVITISLIALASLLVIWNSYQLPNLAWDTWTVWVARAKQWYYHGLGVSFTQPNEWLDSSSSLLNLSSHYPDGVSLIFYPMLFFSDTAKPMVLGLYLMMYGFLVLLMCNRLQKANTPFYLRLFLIVVMYTTPLMVNHLLLPGYADLMMAAYILLIMLGLLDYNDQPKPALRLLIICYALMLPLIKLEGWVWLLVALFSHSFIMWFNQKQRLIIMAIMAATFLLWFLWGGITVKTPFGPLIISPEEINLFNKAYIAFGFTNVTEAVFNSLFWQLNWSLLWFGLPFLLLFMVRYHHNKAQQVSHLFFTLAFSLILLLFYLTPAAKYAQDYTAINRIFLQLMPCYILLLFNMLATVANQTKSPPIVNRD